MSARCPDAPRTPRPRNQLVHGQRSTPTAPTVRTRPQAHRSPSHRTRGRFLASTLHIAVHHLTSFWQVGSEGVKVCSLVAPRGRRRDWVSASNTDTPATAPHRARRRRQDDASFGRCSVGQPLEDGALGELIRLRPWRDHGCLVCHRDALAVGAGPATALSACGCHGE